MQVESFRVSVKGALKGRLIRSIENVSLLTNEGVLDFSDLKLRTMRRQFLQLVTIHFIVIV